MNLVRITALSAFLAATASFASPPPDTLLSLRQRQVGELEKRGFKCSPPAASMASAGGTSPSPVTCIGKMPSYSATQEVAILIPSSYQLPDRGELVLHFHGWNLPPARPLPEIVRFFDLLGAIEGSGREALMIVPYSDGRNEDHLKIAPQERFDAFMRELMDLAHDTRLVRSRRLGSITLTTHSGGVRPVTRLLEQAVAQQRALDSSAGAKVGAASRIHEVYSIDSAYDKAFLGFWTDYGSKDAYYAFASRSENRLWLSNTGEVSQSLALLTAQLCNRDAETAKSNNPPPACQNPSAPRYIEVKPDFTPASLSRSRVGVVNAVGSGIFHDPSVNAFLGRFLKR